VTIRSLLVDIHGLGALASDQLLLLLLGSLGLGLVAVDFLVDRRLLQVLHCDLVGLHLHGLVELLVERLLDLVAVLRRQQMLVLGDELAVGFELCGAVAGHAVLVELPFSLRPNLANARHGLECACDEVAVVAHGNVAALLELESAVDSHLLAVRAAEGLGPAELARVTLHFEVLVAF
jgi:hypothetical protein